MRAALLVVLVGCGFEGKASPDAFDPDAPREDPGDGDDAAVMPIDAPPPGPAINLLAPENGGIVRTISSEYCDGTATQGWDCEGDRWTASNLIDGGLGSGFGTQSAPHIWCSPNKDGATTPEEFTFSLGSLATIDHLKIQNFGEADAGANHYSRQIKVLGMKEGDADYATLLDTELAASEALQEFPITPVDVDRLRLQIVTAYSTTYWQLGEIEAWGHPK